MNYSYKSYITLFPSQISSVGLLHESFLLILHCEVVGIGETLSFVSYAYVL